MIISHIGIAAQPGNGTILMRFDTREHQTIQYEFSEANALLLVEKLQNWLRRLREHQTSITD